MTNDGHSVGILDGDMEVEERFLAFERFRQGSEKVLITTNVLARGKNAHQFMLTLTYLIQCGNNFTENKMKNFRHRRRASHPGGEL